jgi:hypothetical protein
MIPAAIKPPKALANMFAPYRIAIRGGSSERLYQQDSSRKTPGRNGPSTRPRIKRHIKSPAKLVVNAWHMETIPQAAVTHPMYREGLTLRIRIFEGTWVRTSSRIRDAL